MALSGHDTPVLVYNSTAATKSYSGTLSGVTAGDLIVVCVTALSDSAANTPSGWTVTLGPDTLTYQNGQSSSGVFGFSAIYFGVATATGNPTLTVASVNNCRSQAAHAFIITGFDTGTPIANSGQLKNHSTDVSSLTEPSGVTTAANGNAIIGCVSVKSGATTGLAVGAADGSTVGQSGGSSTNDHEWGVAWDETPTATSVTFAWAWTGANRVGATWVEVAAGAGGSPATANAGQGSVDVQGVAPTSGAGASASSGAGAIAVQGYAPTATAGVSASADCGTGAITVQGFAPTASAGISAAAATGTGAITTQGIAPTVSVGGAATADTGNGGVTVHGIAPIASAGVTILCGTGSVVAQGHAPTISVGGLVAANTGIGAVTVQGVAPVASAGITISGGTGIVTVQGFPVGSGVKFIILAANNQPGFAVIGGRGSIVAIGGGN